MRKIKFRGQSVDNGDWRYGFYREFSMPSCWAYEAYRDGVNYYIDVKGSNESWLVIPETVGQYTGLKDRNGREIYENDIVKYKDTYDKCIGIVRLGKWEQDGSGGEYVGADCLGFYLERVKSTNEEPCKPEHFKNYSLVAEEIENIEVIGDIYSTPELLKEGE